MFNIAISILLLLCSNQDKQTYLTKGEGGEPPCLREVLTRLSKNPLLKWKTDENGSPLNQNYVSFQFLSVETKPEYHYWGKDTVVFTVKIVEKDGRSHRKTIEYYQPAGIIYGFASSTTPTYEYTGQVILPSLNPNKLLKLGYPNKYNLYEMAMPKTPDIAHRICLLSLKSYLSDTAGTSTLHYSLLPMFKKNGRLCYTSPNNGQLITTNFLKEYKKYMAKLSKARSVSGK